MGIKLNVEESVAWTSQPQPPDFIMCGPGVCIQVVDTHQCYKRKVRLAVMLMRNITVYKRCAVFLGFANIVSVSFFFNKHVLFFWQPKFLEQASITHISQDRLREVEDVVSWRLVRIVVDTPRFCGLGNTLA